MRKLRDGEVKVHTLFRNTHTIDLSYIRPFVGMTFADAIRAVKPGGTHPFPKDSVTIQPPYFLNDVETPEDSVVVIKQGDVLKLDPR